MDGFLVLDKQPGMTSHDVVSRVRGILRQKKAGHTGTLDPFATGVLPLALGEATKAIPFLDESIKEYRAVMCLGISTDTQDCTGNVLKQFPCDNVSKDLLLATIERFRGTLKQTPPMFSAVKKDGIPLYRLARRGEDVERTPREITVHDISIESVEMPFVTFTVACSRGTYVRTLASDMGDAIGRGAHLVELRRLRSGSFTLDSAVSLDRLNSLRENGGLEQVLLSPYDALSHLGDACLTENGAKKVRHGISPSLDDFSAFPHEYQGRCRRLRLSFHERLLAVASYDPSADSDNKKTFCLLRVFS